MEEIEFGLYKQQWEGKGEERQFLMICSPLFPFCQAQGLGDQYRRVVVIVQQLTASVVLIAKGCPWSSRLDLSIMCTLGKCIGNSNDDKKSNSNNHNSDGSNIV